MKNKTAVFLSFILAFSFSAFAQTKTVTNADLEKFRQKRLQAEREYRENYERLGFPSPEELEKKRVEDEKELIDYSQQLEANRLEREAIRTEAEIEALRLQNQYLQLQTVDSGRDSVVYYSGGGFYPYYGGFYNRPFYRPRFFGHRNRNINPYPWIVIPNLDNRVIRIPQPRFPGINPRPRRGRY